MIGALILLGFGGYLFLSLLSAWPEESPIFFRFLAMLLSALLLSQAWLFFFFFRAPAEARLRMEKPLLRFAFHSMGLLSFLFTFSALRDLVALPWAALDSTVPLRGVWPSGGILAASLGFLAVGFWNARNRIECPELLLPIGPAGMQELRIAHLSDLHLGTGPDRKQVQERVETVLGLHPHLIVLTGDIIDGAVSELKAELGELARLRAPHGCWFVPGNHEFYWNAETSLKALREIGFEILVNEGRMVRPHGVPVFLGGVSDPAGPPFGGAPPVIPIPPPDAALRILLAHRPDFAQKASERGYDLQLSGHTHGGQFFPWNFVVRWIHRHSAGLHRWGTLLLFVHRGSGTWGPPVRLGTRSEVALLRITAINW